MSRETPILVCTDVGARGLDSAHADLVINIECSDKNEVMAHRIGRGGRFGKGAQCVFITATSEEFQIVKNFGTKMQIQFNNFTNINDMAGDINKHLNCSKVNHEKEQQEITGEIIEPSTSDNSVINVGEIVLASLIEKDQTEASTLSSHSNFDDINDTIRVPPQIPAIWETLRIPPPSGTLLEENEIDDMTDAQFEQWRRDHKPRLDPDFNPNDNGIDQPDVNLGFYTTVLDGKISSDRTSYHSLEEFENTEEDHTYYEKESCVQSSKPFIDLYNDLYSQWRCYHTH